MTDEQALEAVNMDEAKRMADLLMEAYPDGCWLKAKINVGLVARALVAQEARARKLVGALALAEENIAMWTKIKNPDWDGAATPGSALGKIRAALAEGRGK